MLYNKFITTVSPLYNSIIYFINILRWVRLCPLGTAATLGLLYQPQIIADGDCGAVGGIKTGRGNRNHWG
jgi:hypothetical protein